MVVRLLAPLSALSLCLSLSLALHGLALFLHFSKQAETAVFGNSYLAGFRAFPKADTDPQIRLGYHLFLAFRHSQAPFYKS